MFFFFSKILLFLIAPVSWIVLFIVLALVSKDIVRRRKYILTVFILLLFFTNTFIFDRFMNAWEVKAIPDNKLENYEAAIVLTGMTTFDPEINRLEFNDRTDRLMQAIRLYKEGKIKKIFLCGGPATVKGDDVFEAPELKHFLEKTGIPAEDLILESSSRNTHENAVYMKLLLKENFKNEKLYLISSAWHLRRATACFLNEGILVIPYSTDRYSGPVKYDLDYLFIPSSATLFNWEKLTHEWVGSVVYWMRGYFPPPPYD